MRLGEKQELFMRLLPRLIDKAHELGFEIRGGELQRSEEAARWNAEHCRVCKRTKPRHAPNGHQFRAIGIVESLHRKKLAIDLNLFRGELFLTQTDDHRELGEFWESLHPLCRWGGRFSNPDGCHYAITHGGRQ